MDTPVAILELSEQLGISPDILVVIILFLIFIWLLNKDEKKKRSRR